MTPVVAFIVPAAAGDTEYAIDVLLVAVATYVSSGASWQISIAPDVNEVAPVEGLTVTTISVTLPGHELAVGVTW